jgi:hypothetical protein
MMNLYKIKKMKELEITKYQNNKNKNFYFLLVFLLFMNLFDAIQSNKDIAKNKNTRNKTLEEIFQNFDFQNGNNNNQIISKGK